MSIFYVFLFYSQQGTVAKLSPKKGTVEKKKLGTADLRIHILLYIRITTLLCMFYLSKIYKHNIYIITHLTESVNVFLE
jgi:hypothetical protein